MIYDLTVEVTIRNKPEYRESLAVTQRAVILLESFADIAFVMDAFHTLTTRLQEEHQAPGKDQA